MADDRTPGLAGRRRRRRWGTVVLGVGLLAVGFVAGYFAHRERIVTRSTWNRVTTLLHLAEPASNLDGQWNPIQPRSDAADLDPAQRREVQRLLSLGYAYGTVPAPDESGVTVCDTARAETRPRLYLSGHAPVALLIDRAGRLLHRWHYPYPDAWREETAEELTQSGFTPTTGCWRRARLLPDGELLALYEGRDLIKLDRDSHLVWRYAAHCHHDIDVAADGTIYVLTREAGLVEAINEREPVLVDSITVLAPDGTLKRRISVLDAFLRSDHAPVLARMASSGDLMHTNAIRIFDGSLADRSPLFARGHALISLRELDLVAIVDLHEERVVWTMTGFWIKQHDPRLLPSGTLLVFDNLGHGGRSQVVEIDPFTQQVVWSYADGPGHSLYSKTCGSSQRLASGNTLIVESDNGRAFEVDPAGTIVWEYRNPRRTGEDDELIAAILDMVVLPADYDLSWLSRPSS